ncbi:hypothetical protein ACX8Z9_08165 [Arthrobacter halodurans]|uniref:Uncharacterized protein n=1 Tax=Arthrobacter halodurans TaxID=516699 RepID=A0ABV4UJK7_9MICC
MEAIELPETAGSIVEERGTPAIGVGFMATLVPTKWDPRTRSFNGLVWCKPAGIDETGVWPVSPKKLRGGKVLHVGPAPKPTGKRPLRRLGTVALLDGIVYTYCPMWLLNGTPEHAMWLYAAKGVAANDVERHGTELVPGMP